MLLTRSAVEDRHLIYILQRVNPVKLYSLDLFKSGPKLTINSIGLLSQLINLKYLRLNGLQSDLLSEALTSLVSLRDLDLRSKSIDEDCMNNIAENLTRLTRLFCATSEKLYRWRSVYKLTTLKELTLALTYNFTAEGYADVAKLNSVTFLNVNANSNINNDMLVHLLSMTNLETLLFTDAKVSDPRAYSGLAKMTKLRKLHANILPDEEALSYISQAYSLTSLAVKLGGREVHELSAKFLSGLTNLKILVGTCLKDTQSLQTLTNLEKFTRADQHIDENFPLEALTNLTEITAQSLDTKVLEKLSYLVNLRELRFREISNPRRERDFESIPCCKNLQCLIYHGPPVSNEQLGYIAKCTNLAELFVRASPKCANEYAKLNQLTSLELDHADWDLTAMGKLTSLTKLKNLKIKSGNFITRDHETEIPYMFIPDVRTKLTVYVYE